MGFLGARLICHAVSLFERMSASEGGPGQAGTLIADGAVEDVQVSDRFACNWRATGGGDRGAIAVTYVMDDGQVSGWIAQDWTGSQANVTGTTAEVGC